MKINAFLFIFICSLNLFCVYVNNPLYIYLEKSDLVVRGEIINIIKAPETKRNNEYSVNDIYYVYISAVYKKSQKINESHLSNISINDTIKFHFCSSGRFPIMGESGILFSELREKKLQIIHPLWVESIENEEVLFELCKKDNISKELILAISNNDIKHIERCVELGALKTPSSYYQKYFKVTPIINAIRQNNKEIGKYLIQNGADIKQDTLSGISPLSEAVMKNNVQIIKILYKSGADLNEKDKKGNTLLMYVLGHSSIDIIKFLLDKGIDINAQNNNGTTALLMDIQKNNSDIKLVKFLLKNGADPKITNNDDNNCYDFVDKNDEVLLKLLRKYD